MSNLLISAVMIAYVTGAVVCFGCLMTTYVRNKKTSLRRGSLPFVVLVSVLISALWPLLLCIYLGESAWEFVADIWSLWK